LQGLNNQRGETKSLPRLTRRRISRGVFLYKKFPNDGKNFRIYHGILSHEGVCYSENEDAIYKQKYAYFTHRHVTEAVR
jgi:hypothetical protein